MAKDKLTEYSATNASNDVIGDISVAEGMLPSAVNNALREQMTHLKNFADGTDAINALAVDNLKLDGNTISSTDTNGNITIDPDGTGKVAFASDITMTSDDPTITMTDSSGTNDIATIQATSGALIITARDGSADGEIIFKKTDGSTTDETMRIDASGALSVGKVTPDDTTLGVHISKSGTTTGRVTFTGDNSSGDAGFYGTNTSGSGVFIVRPNGNVQNVNNSYGAISDLNLKENIQDASSQWDDVKSLKVRKYSLISEASDTPTQLGVIAQEVEDAGMSGLVHETWDIANPDVNIKHVKYSILYMKAVKALQEAMERIETLETKVQALEDA